MFKKIMRGSAAFVALFLALALGVNPASAWEEHDNIIASGHGSFAPQYLVIHSTANPGATAWDHVQFWQRQGNNAYMTQWVCDWTGDGTVYQVAPGNAITWHVGNGNSHSVGIEICEGTTRDQVDKSIDTAAQWAAYYLKEQGCGIDRMVSHDEARSLWGGTDHTDPNPYFSRWGYTWQSFKNKVADYMRGGTGEVKPEHHEQENPITSSVSGSTEDLAARVMRGEFGSGQARRSALGSRYDEVQAYVNWRYFGIGAGANTSSARPTVAQLAARVMRGEFGSGQARRSALGARYNEVQTYVNRIYYNIY